MAVSKVLHLLRPRFIPIADSYVRECLGVWGATPSGRMSAVQRAVHRIGNENQSALHALDGYARSLGSATIARGPYRGRAIPVVLSNVRILDIIMWADVAIHGRQPHPDWKQWHVMYTSPRSRL